MGGQLTPGATQVATVSEMRTDHATRYWHSEHPTLCCGDMTIQRMDNVLIVVEDLDAAKAFFAELGMELEGEITVEGPWVDQTVGLHGVRATNAMMRTTGSASCVDLRASSSDWPSSSAEAPWVRP